MKVVIESSAIVSILLKLFILTSVSSNISCSLFESLSNTKKAVFSNHDFADKNFILKKNSDYLSKLKLLVNHLNNYHYDYSNDLNLNLIRPTADNLYDRHQKKKHSSSSSLKDASYINKRSRQQKQPKQKQKQPKPKQKPKEKILEEDQPKKINKYIQQLYADIFNNIYYDEREKTCKQPDIIDRYKIFRNVDGEKGVEQVLYVLNLLETQLRTKYGDEQFDQIKNYLPTDDQKYPVESLYIVLESYLKCLSS